MAGLLDVADELGGDVHGIDLALVADGPRKQAAEEACARADVCHDHARLKIAGHNYSFLVGVNLPTFDFEFLEEVLDVGIVKRLVDTRPYALLLAQS